MDIKKQIEEILEETNETYIKISYLLSKLDFSEFIKEESNSKFSLLSIAKLYVFKLVKGIRTFYQLIDYLKENKSEAFLLGFYLDYKNELFLPSKRTFNHYLQSNREKLSLIAKEILSIATKKKIVLDLQIVKKVIKERKKNYDREIKEAVKLVKKLVYPLISLKIKNNGKFTTKDLLDVLVHVALTHDFANNGSFTFKEMNPEKESPSGDLMMYHFSKFKSVSKITSMSEKILDVILNFAKRNYNILQYRKLNIAYDIHKIPFYGRNIGYVCGGKHERGTSNFLQFLTCSVVVAGRRFILDIIPMHPFDTLEELIDSSLSRVKNKIKIDKAYFDRGFNSSKIINVLRKHQIDFIMPMTRTLTVKSCFDKSEGCESRVIDFQISKGENKALVKLVLVNDKDGIKRAFICNFNIPPQLAYRLYEMYGKRWGIETSYRNLEKDFKPRTTTTNYQIRLFYFVFSACLYNLWILVNICVSLIIYGRIKDKPIITAKMFAVMLYRVQEEYFGDGG